MAEEVVLMKGNEAIAHAAIRFGVDGYFGYPITPQSEILETLADEKPLGNYRYGSASGRKRSSSYQYGIRRCSQRKNGNDLFFKPRCELETRRHFVHCRSRTPLFNCECHAWRSRLGNHPAQPGRLLPDSKKEEDTVTIA